MQDEYRGKSIFSRRYIGMSEEAIREEIDRLQGKVYALEKALDAMKADDKEFVNAIEEKQQKLEKLAQNIDDKITKLQNSLDYETPIKTQLDNATKSIGKEVRKVNNESIGWIVKFLEIDTIILVIILGLIIYKSIII